ncbi:MAG: uroporphyrinogen decarboxylase [candidate division Zixibacteria bacterium]
MSNFSLIDAAWGKPHDRIPAWIMRQGGRYLPEYREIKKTHTFLDICRSPQLMADVALQPVDIIGVDAAIIFSDILLPLEPLGIKIGFDKSGAKIMPLIRTDKDVASLREYNPEDKLKIVLEGISETKKRLKGKLPLIGFCGAPFTLLHYMVEGKGNGGGAEINRFIHDNQSAAEKVLDLLSDILGEYLKAQIKAGADIVQIFDSRGEILSPEDYQRFSLPYIQKTLEKSKTPDIPRIVFNPNCSPYLELLAGLDCEVIGIDWRTDLKRAFSILDGKTVQGNLDPHLLLTSPRIIQTEVMLLLNEVSDYNRYIFNLGHGIQPTTPVDNARLVIETVHTYNYKNKGENKIDSTTTS